MIRAGVENIKDAVTSHELVVEGVDSVLIEATNRLGSAYHMARTALGALRVALSDFAGASGDELVSRIEHLEPANNAASALGLQDMNQEPAGRILAALARFTDLSKDLQAAYALRAGALEEGGKAGISIIDRALGIVSLATEQTVALSDAGYHLDAIETSSTQAITAAATLTERL
jgi:hypothetical protein